MLRYIPDFILERYLQKELEGCFTGFALLFDIADFTPISTEFQRHGKQGAEELSIFLDYVFGEPIRIVEGRGGFVSLFAGDAFCAIFPDQDGVSDASDAAMEQGTDSRPVLDAVLSIRKFFEGNGSYHCSLGDFALKIRQTLTYGLIHWQIFDNELQCEYVFQGEPLKAWTELSSHKQELIFSSPAMEQLGSENFSPNPAGGYLLKPELLSHPIGSSSLSSSKREPHPGHDTSPAQNAFLNPRYHKESIQAEIRSAAFCFANLEAIPNEERNRAVGTLQLLANKYGGFINKYDASDKGLVALILFGIPRSEGKTLERICNFALEAVEDLPQVRMGISCGSVVATYTGTTNVQEYTALGAPVNLASRLMSKARPGEVLADGYLWQELHALYDFVYMGSLSLKGIENPIRYYRVQRLVQSQQQNTSPFVGREHEISRIRNIIDTCLQNKDNAIVYISGDAGIGKSRLVKEALSIYGSMTAEAGRKCYKYYLSSDVILRKPLEAIKQMIRTQFYYNPVLPKEAGIAMFRALWLQLDPFAQDAELRRIESIIASLLDFDWEGSIWTMLPPKERPEQLKNALLYFLRKLCASLPILIHLDDAQWLDDESQALLKAASAVGLKPLIIISPCRYLDDGSKVELGLCKHQRYDLELGSLDETGSSELIKSIMRLSKVPDATLDLIFNRSMGNPLFIEQLSSYLLETGSVNDKGEIVKELGYLSTFSISDIISSRIDRLTQNVKECLYGASVLGMEFDLRILSEMLKSDLKQELDTGKSNLIWKELNELQYIFSHILIKDITYQSMLSGKLKELHKLAAVAMETVYQDTLDENAEEIAYHFEKAELEEKAAEYFTHAGKFYHHIFNLFQADICLNAALRIHETLHPKDDEEIAELYSLLYKLQIDKGEYTKAEKCAQIETDIIERICGRSNLRTAYALLHLGIAKRHRGYMDDAKQILLEVLYIREQLAGLDHPSTAMAISNLIPSLMYSGENLKAEEYGKRMIKILDSCEDLDPMRKSYIYYRYGEALIGVGKLTEAENNLCEAIRIMDTYIYDHPSICRMLTSLAISYRCKRKHDLAEVQLNRALRINEKFFGADSVNSISSMEELAGVYNSRQEYQKAIDLIQKVIEIVQKTGITIHPIHALSIFRMANSYHQLGQYITAETLYLEALDFYLKTSGLNHRLTQYNIKMLIDLYEKMDEPEKAVLYRAVLLQGEKAQV